MNKYKLTKETQTFLGIKLFRIQANTSFGIVSAGEKGGWIEKLSNLSAVLEIEEKRNKIYVCLHLGTS